jgi:hypothetical protein
LYFSKAIPWLEIITKKKKEKEADEFSGNNEINPLQEPLLNVADYLCWTIQRVFERGETRYSLLGSCPHESKSEYFLHCWPSKKEESLC